MRPLDPVACDLGGRRSRLSAGVVAQTVVGWFVSAHADSCIYSVSLSTVACAALHGQQVQNMSKYVRCMYADGTRVIKQFYFETALTTYNKQGLINNLEGPVDPSSVPLQDERPFIALLATHDRFFSSFS